MLITDHARRLYLNLPEWPQVERLEAVGLGLGVGSQ